MFKLIRLTFPLRLKAYGLTLTHWASAIKRQQRSRLIRLLYIAFTLVWPSGFVKFMDDWQFCVYQLTFTLRKFEIVLPLWKTARQHFPLRSPRRIRDQRGKDFVCVLVHPSMTVDLSLGRRMLSHAVLFLRQMSNF